jgi:hypothetical protein
MNRLPTTAPAALLALLTLAVGAARADPVGFSYNVSISPGDLNAWGPGPISLSQSAAADGSSLTVNFGSGTSTLTAVAGSATATPGGADFWSATPTAIPIATATSATIANGPAVNFSFNATPTITLHLTDTTSGTSGDVTLGGALGGSVFPDRSTSLGAGAAWGLWYSSVTLGGHTYSVDVSNSGVALNAAGGDPVTLFAQVYVDRPAPDWNPGGPPWAPGPGGVDLSTAPEPSSLLLAGTAMSLVGLAASRRRRVIRAAPAMTTRRSQGRPGMITLVPASAEGRGK